MRKGTGRGSGKKVPRERIELPTRGFSILAGALAQPLTNSVILPVSPLLASIDATTTYDIQITHTNTPHRHSDVGGV